MEIKELKERIIDNVSSVIFGKNDIVEKLTAAFMMHGHVLLEDVPGTGKTMMARAFAKSLGMGFKRVQFTPDLLPTDLTGLSVFEKETGRFEFREGPVFTNLLLADEINRATPKTQSALLEAMGENQVTIDGKTHTLDERFFVIATQNPIEYEGTFPLPEAQLDRFSMTLKIGYPESRTETDMLTSQTDHHPIEDAKTVLTSGEVGLLRNAVKGVTVDGTVKDYIVSIVRETRYDRNLYLGGSPRASLNIMKGSMAHALLDGRDYVIPDDVKWIAGDILRHRLILTSEARIRLVKIDDIVKDVMDRIPVPVMRKDEV